MKTAITDTKYLGKAVSLESKKRMPGNPPSAFDSNRFERSQRLAAFAQFSDQSPRRLLSGHELSPISAESPEQHRVHRMFGEEIFTSRVETTGYRLIHTNGDANRRGSRLVAVSLVSAGEAVVGTEKVSYKLNTGDIYITTANSMRATLGPGVVTRLLLADEALGKVTDQAGGLITFRGSTATGRLLSHTISAVETTLTETGGLGANDPLNLIAKDIVSRLLASDQADQPQETLRERVRVFVMDNIADTTLTPKTIAEYLGMSRASLYRAFPVPGGVMAYVVEVRLDVARSLLASTKSGGHRAINEVAFLCGFKSPSHFSQAFKRTYGVSPTLVANTETNVLRDERRTNFPNHS
ncbi:AraC family transcriptional regulator [uncultured Tateyamaria sp.]|uniref:helix-turn-helix transcriptional regulator n=1 Tax=uncultured Tateyamaria sp. TaxID=455651 RepID=UPI002613B654|nr:AraC family transcriptional regulator [uncultured Tateyamaria sp.]